MIVGKRSVIIFRPSFVLPVFSETQPAIFATPILRIHYKGTVITFKQKEFEFCNAHRLKGISVLEARVLNTGCALTIEEESVTIGGSRVYGCETVPAHCCTTIKPK